MYNFDLVSFMWGLAFVLILTLAMLSPFLGG